MYVKNISEVNVFEFEIFASHYLSILLFFNVFQGV